MKRSTSRPTRRMLWTVGLLSLVLLASCTLGRMIRYNDSGVDDYKIFPYRELHASKTPFSIPENPEPGVFPEHFEFEGRTHDIDTFLTENDSLAFIAIKNGRIIAERYYNGHSAASISLSFSMAKSFTSLLIGLAIEDGYIRSENQLVTEFVPELKDKGFDRVTLRHLLQMTSGSDYIEVDHPFCVHPWYYYTEDMTYYLTRMKIVDEPGTKWRYKSGDNELLALILQRVLPNGVTITDYMQEKIWEPLGMEYDARWSVDRLPDGLEKTFCCVAATARDFAKIGLMALQNGTWNGRQVVPREWLEKSTKIDESEGSPWNYQYQWWKLTKSGEDFFAGGWLGQYIYVNRKYDLVLVRMGRSFGDIGMKAWRKLWVVLAERIGTYENDETPGEKSP